MCSSDLASGNQAGVRYHIVIVGVAHAFGLQGQREGGQGGGDLYFALFEGAAEGLGAVVGGLEGDEIGRASCRERV